MKKLRMTVNIAMTAVLLGLMAYSLIGTLTHEILGALMFEPEMVRSLAERQIQCIPNCSNDVSHYAHRFSIGISSQRDHPVGTFIQVPSPQQRSLGCPERPYGMCISELHIDVTAFRISLECHDQFDE